jgi:hypothetical protein
MSKIVFEACHGRKYQGKEGEKTAWTKCGVVIENDKGNMTLIIEYMPTSSDGKPIMLNLFVPKPKEDKVASF